jgi:pilus assembly protein CpaB
MNIQRLTLIAAALLIAGATAFVVNGQLKERPVAVKAPAPEAPAALSLPEVLVAKKELPVGTFIQPDQLSWRPWPEESLNEGYLVKGQASEKDLAGAVVRTHLYPGEPITTSRVVHPGEQGFLSAVLQPGQRAVAIPVDATSGVAGFVFPGDYVDVLFTLKRTVAGDGAEASEVRQFSQTLITDVRVLAIDQTVDRNDGAAKVGRTATLQVTSGQAERLALALDMGTLSLSLRSLGRMEADLGSPAGPKAVADDASAAGRSYTRDTDVLFMIGDPLGVPPPLALRRKVEVMRGSESKQVRF